VLGLAGRFFRGNVSPLNALVNGASFTVLSVVTAGTTTASVTLANNGNLSFSGVTSAPAATTWLLPGGLPGDYETLVSPVPPSDPPSFGPVNTWLDQADTRVWFTASTFDTVQHTFTVTVRNKADFADTITFTVTLRAEVSF
jgi:hypothetical protein